MLARHPRQATLIVVAKHEPSSMMMKSSGLDKKRAWLGSCSAKGEPPPRADS
jgi:hypothetical protein